MSGDINVTSPTATWLQLATGAYAIGSGGSDDVRTVMMDASDVSITAEGLYQAQIEITHNDATKANPHVIPVDFLVYDESTLIADFEGIPTSGSPPLEVSFTSSPLIDADNFYWKFGDGDESADVNPVHTYTEPGVYDVFLQVFRNVDGCLLSDSIVKAGYVDVFFCSCPYQGDLDADGFRTALDLAEQLDCLFGGGGCPADPTCQTGRCDWDGDCFCTGIDLALLIDHLFYGGPPPVDPCTAGPGGRPIDCL